MHFTIERLRTMVLAAGILLLVSLGVFLAVARFRHPINLKELPKKLGIDIQQEANGVTFSHALGAHSQFKIHASKVVQLKTNHMVLHDVRIELYGDDGRRVDRIEGAEFEYDQKQETATAAGPVEITLMRPGVALGITPRPAPDLVVKGKPISRPLAEAAEQAAAGDVHVKTSGLTFDQRTGVATTSQRVDFSLKQGSGSSMGATYDSEAGNLILDRAVELRTERNGDAVTIHAEHAEFAHDAMVCLLRAATADYRAGKATAADAKIFFRDDGSATRLEATNGFTLATATGGHVAAPTGTLDFDEHNQPRHGRLEGGVRMDSVSGNRQINGTAPTVDLEFTSKGLLHQAHMERGVEFRSEEVSGGANSASAQRLSRTWRSPVADLVFRDTGHGQVEPASIHGTGGVTITGLSQRGKGAPSPSLLVADVVDGEFGPDSVLTAMTGTGHAGIEETTASGDRETASGDRLQARFAAGAKGAGEAKGGRSSQPEVQSAVLDGHVVLVDSSAAKAGAQPKPPLRATAGQAEYEGAGQWLHLTLNPRVEDGAMQLTADAIDVSQASGDAFAHGNVKATWADAGRNGTANAATSAQAQQDSISLGGQGPAHAIAQQAELHRVSDVVTFTGHARLWQQADSIAGPVIVLDRRKKTLAARSTNPAEPVRVVLLSASGLTPGSNAGKEPGGKAGAPSVIRVHGGELDYSDTDREAVMVGGSLGQVIADTGTANSVSNRVELFLAPAGSRTGKDSGQGQVERMTASGHVVVTSEGRRGTGEQLMYTSKTGEYVLTGTAATPPRITDPARGNVTGAALIFHSRDDSVSIEGEGRETRTETTVRQGKGGSEPQR